MNFQATPKEKGSMEGFGSSECTLIWQRPRALHSWNEVPMLKLMISVKLIAAETGNVVGEADTKFKAIVDPDAICTAEEPPHFRVIFNSEKALLDRKHKNRSNLQTAKSKTESKRFTAAPSAPPQAAHSRAVENTSKFLLFGFLCCLLAVVISRLLAGE
ncbi:unnamed protein product [Gongylonema pulchrum]|uniref:MSP domain-containing protein n=1 Tax=Gongylonema pulchrum TaxID=637853 RepID=A0A183CXN0_9BILA|nr:unnamed protein product [Gongylonema pulchrum]